MIKQNPLFDKKLDVEIRSLLCIKGICSTHLASKAFGYFQSAISRAVNRIRERKMVGKKSRNEYLRDD